MKLHVGIRSNPLDGYVNIDPVPGQGKVLSGIENLDNHCHNNQCHKIIIDNVLNYIHWTKLAQVVSHYCSKLRHNAEITILGTDLYEVIRNFYLGKIDSGQLNSTMYGDGKDAWGFQYGVYDIETICSLLEKLNIKILKKELHDNFQYTIVGIRN